MSPPLRTGSDRITADTLSCIAILEVSDRKSKDGAWRVVSSSRPSLTATFALTVCQKLPLSRSPQDMALVVLCFPRMAAHQRTANNHVPTRP